MLAVRARARRRARRAFTLLESVVVVTIIGIVTTIVVVTGSSVSQQVGDLAGQPLLAAAQAQARRVAALDHYSWQQFDTAQPSPSDALAASMARGQADATRGGITFVAGPSGTPRQVSVAWADGTHVAFATLTSPGHCLLMVDTLTGGTHWAQDTSAAAGGCDAQVAAGTVAACPQIIAGDESTPTKLSVAAPCATATDAGTDPTPTAG